MPILLAIKFIENGDWSVISACAHAYRGLTTET